MEDLEPQTTFHFKTKKIRSVKHQAQMVSLLKKKKINNNNNNKKHGFKNRTGPAGPTGSTGNRPLIRSGYTKKPEIS